MSKSTGTISKVIQPSTLLGEEARVLDQDVFSGPSASTISGDRWCVIKDIHKTDSRVKLVDARNQKMYPFGKETWVTIVDAEDIRNRYGQLQVGMLVRADYSGIGGQTVYATVMGRPMDKPVGVQRALNDQPMSWYRAAAPGTGIGV